MRWRTPAVALAIAIAIVGCGATDTGACVPGKPPELDLSAGSWSREPLGPAGGAGPLHVVSDGNTVVVAAAREGGVLVWTEGHTLPVDLDSTQPISELSALVAGLDGFVMFTEDRDTFFPTTWTSVDRRDWQRADAAGFPREASVSDAVVVGDEIVAVGALRASDTSPGNGPFYAGTWIVDPATGTRWSPPDPLGGL